ncbi:MAG: LysR family transcriptional regulator [Burkholderiales bacterium PBB3]|nr:MAG: LysR family transcriptional regulator [Burkholderiales bacterium PBB3]
MKELTLRGLRIFEAAASSASFSHGAEVMGMTKSAVSQQIRQLEEETGARLFDTMVRPIQVTDAGRELLRHARIILAQVAVASDAMKSLRGQFSGRLTLGVVQPANYFVPYIMTAFKRLFPDVHIRMVIEKRDTLLTMLADHSIDLAIGGYPTMQPEVEAQVFARHPHCLIVSPDHPLRGRYQLTWNDLRHEAFVFREQGSATRKFLEHLLQVQGLHVDINMELEGCEAVKQAVMAGMGISFMSAHAIQTELLAGKVAILDLADMPKWIDWCIWSRRDTDVPTIRAAFQNFVLTEGARFTTCQISSVSGCEITELRAAA